MLKLKQRSKVAPLAFIGVGAIIGGLLGFYAFLGVLFLHNTKPTPTFSSTCDVIERENDLLWCKARMNTEDENITVLRGE